MKQVAELYEDLVSRGEVAGISRFNLRRFCRSFDLPPCGVSFWRLDDLNWDYLQSLNSRLKSDKFWFRGGESFPRTYWDNHVLGHQRRSEFIYLCTKPHHHERWRGFFQHGFSNCRRDFGKPFPQWPEKVDPELSAFFRTSLLQDLIHFTHEVDQLENLADFHLVLFFLSKLEQPPEATRDQIFETFRRENSRFRAEITRIITTRDPSERLDDSLDLLSKLG